MGAWIGAAFGRADASVAEAAALLADWSRAAGLPGLDALEIDAAACQAAAQAAAGSSSMRANPAPLSADDLDALMRAAA